MTSKNYDKNILWTAPDNLLPKSLWDRLEGSGYKVMLADQKGNSAEALEKVLPCLWVAHVNGNPESEISFFEEIKSKFHELPIILISNNPNIEDAVSFIRIGISDYVPEDVSNEKLWAIIESALKFPHLPKIPKPDKSAVSGKSGTPIAVHPSMLNILKLAKKIAPSRSTVLIQGESGTGKEVIARYVHNNSDRKSGPFIAVNCAALPENLLESELFGHERGSFTGAVSRKKGKFELADGGTLLLDEISEMAVSVQAKLLRVLQEREIDRVGGEYSVPVDVHVIATTNRDLEAETKNGNFRLDLFYRLNVVPLSLPPLRGREDDIIPLANYFLKSHSTMNRVEIKELSKDAEQFLKNKSWPGNVRELENLMERTTLLVDSDSVSDTDLEMISIPDGGGITTHSPENSVIPLKKMEKKMIFRALNDHEGNRTHAAKVLGISVRTLRNKLHEYKSELEGRENGSKG